MPDVQYVSTRATRKRYGDLFTSTHVAHFRAECPHYAALVPIPSPRGRMPRGLREEATALVLACGREHATCACWQS